MKTRFSYVLVALVAISVMFGCKEPEHVILDIHPYEVHPIPNKSKKEYRKIAEAIEQGSDAYYDVANSPIYQYFYSPTQSGCYDGKYSRVWASSMGRYVCFTQNIHDRDIETAWSEGAYRHGIGEFVVFELPSTNPKVAGVNIVNGYAKSDKAWAENSRVRRMKVYFNDKEYAILNLEDSRSLQRFELGVLEDDPSVCGPTWRFKFEILDVYPGSRYTDTVITEMFFDGFDAN